MLWNQLGTSSSAKKDQAKEREESRKLALLWLARPQKLQPFQVELQAPTLQVERAKQPLARRLLVNVRYMHLSLRCLAATLGRWFTDRNLRHKQQDLHQDYRRRR